MLVTEAEAKATLACKWLRARAGSNPLSAGYNRTVLTWKQDLKERWVRWWRPGWWDYTRGRFFRCDGSKCMAWRWSDNTRRYGYCGHAGIPDFTILPPPYIPKRKFGRIEEALYMIVIGFVMGLVGFIGVNIWIMFN